MRKLLPRDEREDLAVLCAWHELSRRMLEYPASEEAGRRSLDRFTTLLDEVGEGSATQVLGLAFGPLVRRHAIPDHLLRSRLIALERDAHVHAWQTREEQIALARRTVMPEGRLLLRVLGEGNEKREALADALSLGLRLTGWIARLRHDLERGHVRLPMQELARYGVDLGRLRGGGNEENVRRLIEGEIAEARFHLTKGWDLCEELGAWRGRMLAFVLRWHAADLSALEEHRFDALSGPPPSGWLRFAACAVASGISRGLPWRREAGSRGGGRR